MKTRAIGPLPPGSGPRSAADASIRTAKGSAVVGDARAALAGVAAAGVAIATGEVAAGLLPAAPSPVVAMASLVIALQPAGAKDLMVSLFGTNDKLALNFIVAGAALLLGAVLGMVGRRSPSTGVLVFAVFGAVAWWAGVSALLADPAITALVMIVATAGGVGTLRLLLGLAAGSPVTALSEGSSGSPGQVPGPVTEPMPDWERRRFLITSGGLLVGSVVAGGIGRALLDARHPTGQPVSAALPTTSADLVPPPLAADQSLSAPGLTPIVMPADRFYRIDTALLVPQVDASTWKVSVTGMVTTPVTLTYAQLLAMPQFEQYVTIACVSNEVGGNLVGNALWRGVRLKQVLATAGVDAAATQIVGRSVDGFTVGFPTAWAMDPGREPMIAVGMNGGPLPAEHGYPARLIIPGLYGYVSATKWLAEIQLTTREAFDAYWIRLGWAKDGPILTQSRIDHPADGDRLAAGQVWIDGLAWAPDRGITKVEVSIDGGQWQAVLTSRPISKATWVQWMLAWNAPSGQHTIEVRATDGTGTAQTSDLTTPAPDGARGHHRITVSVG